MKKLFFFFFPGVFAAVQRMMGTTVSGHGVLSTGASVLEYSSVCVTSVQIGALHKRIASLSYNHPTLHRLQFMTRTRRGRRRFKERTPPL